MCHAMAQLDQEGLFGIGSARLGVTLFVTVSDSTSALEIETQSALRLNPAPVAEAFARRFD
jgi:hypothetical protein